MAELDELRQGRQGLDRNEGLLFYSSIYHQRSQYPSDQNHGQFQALPQGLQTTFTVTTDVEAQKRVDVTNTHRPAQTLNYKKAKAPYFISGRAIDLSGNVVPSQSIRDASNYQTKTFTCPDPAPFNYDEWRSAKESSEH